MTDRPARILIVDDEPQILRFLGHALTAAGYAVLQAETGAAGLALLRDSGADLLILDLGLPDGDGKELIELLRRDSDLPIIVLSAHDQEMERIIALDLGANDFVAKPFGIGELLARLRVCLRPRRDQGMATLDWPGLRIDRDSREIWRAGQPVKLTRKEFELTLLLAENSGRIMTHRHLLERIWGPAHLEDVPYLRVFIGQLRRKLQLSADSAVQIQTEAGIGYRWTVLSPPA